MCNNAIIIKYAICIQTRKCNFFYYTIKTWFRICLSTMQLLVGTTDGDTDTHALHSQFDTPTFDAYY